MPGGVESLCFVGVKNLNSSLINTEYQESHEINAKYCLQFNFFHKSKSLKSLVQKSNMLELNIKLKPL